MLKSVKNNRRRCIDQTAHITTNNFTTYNVEIHRGGRPECILSPLLFNKVFENETIGSKLNG